jgi:penicillin amidase
MRWAWRLFFGVLILGVAVPAVVGGGGWLWLRTGLPSYEGTLMLPGLGAPVQILRDGRAIPHIQARTMDDAYFALGYVHAQDRLWQMDMMRRLGAGRLAEVMPGGGKDWAVRHDRSMRALGLYRLARSSYDALAPEVRRALDAYAAGVNAYLEHRREPLPIEFQLLGYRPEPWQPADSLVWGKLNALQLSGNFRDELLRARLLVRLSARDVDDLFPTESGPTTLADALSNPATGFAALLESTAAALPPPPGPNTASDEWVVAGNGTSTGRPILANDPHLGLQAPVLWYLARIETPELTLSGATMPGVPFHLLGHNGTIAWGVTATGSDTQDLFVERLDPTNPGRYLTPDGAVPFATRSETIARRGQSDLVVTVQETRHGPVLPEDSPLADTRGPPPGHVLALAFTGLSGSDTTAEAIYRLDRARSWDEFVAALRLYQTPQLNFVYADTAGTIGFYAPGLVPVRDHGNGLVPAPGWSGLYDWTGMIPFDALPHAVNPPSGRIVNANNAPIGPDYPWFLAARWPEPYRARRIDALLDRGGPQSAAASVAMQLDTVSLPARLLLPLMLPRPGPDTEALSRTARAAVALLRPWGGTMGRQDPEPLIFSWWLREFNRALFAERLGPLFSAYWDLHPAVIEHILNDAPTWCDRPGEPGTRTCADLLRTSLEATVRTLAARFGDDPSRWHWGDEHSAPFDHPLLARIPVLRSLFAIGIATDGDNFTLNRGGSHISDDLAPFADTHGPGLRAVYDLANLDQSLFMIATGQSGNPLSPHYQDLVGSWRDGAMITLGAGPRGVRTSTLVLVPQAR